MNANPCIYALNLYVQEGDVVNNNTNVFKKGAMITIVTDTETELKETIIWANETFDIISTGQNSMIYEKVSKEEIINYYNQ